MIAKNLNQKTLISKLSKVIEEKGKAYSKNTFIKARPAIEGEIIITWTSDGKESTNIAGKTDFIVQNPAGEEYIIRQENFEKRYALAKDYNSDKNSKYQVYQSIGKCYGVVVDENILQILGLNLSIKTFEFEPSWGGKMKCNVGDMLVSPNKEISEIYRIAIKEFKETYIELDDL